MTKHLGFVHYYRFRVRLASN